MIKELVNVILNNEELINDIKKANKKAMKDVKNGKAFFPKMYLNVKNCSLFDAFNVSDIEANKIVKEIA